MDDGSTDSTSTIIQTIKLSHPNIKYIHKKNNGCSSALNTGIEHSTGEWIKWLSDDDVLLPTAIEELTKPLQNEQLNNSIIVGDFFLFGKHNITIHEPINIDLRKEIWLRHVYHTFGSLIHRDCFDTVGLFNTKLNYGNDWEWWLRAILKYDIPFYTIPKVVYGYRIHDKSTSYQRLRTLNQKENIIRESISKRKTSLLLKTFPELTFPMKAISIFTKIPMARLYWRLNRYE